MKARPYSTPHRNDTANQWWGPIRSGEYQDYYEKQYGRKLG